MVTGLCGQVASVTRVTISDRSSEFLRLSLAHRATAAPNELRTTNGRFGLYSTSFDSNEYGGKIHGNYECTYETHTDERTCEARTGSPDPAVARLLACHNRQPADQRHGPGNGPAVPGSHRRSRSRRAGPSRGIRQRGWWLLP